MKKFIPILIALVFLSFFNTAVAGEKPLVLKSLYIDMNVNDARNIMGKLMGKDWTISPIGKAISIIPGNLTKFAAEDYIFGALEANDRRGAITGEYGFAIINKYNSYEGFISADPASNKVIRISLSKKITDKIFSTSKISADDFVASFIENYNMPEFYGIHQGWQYKSPKGYIITIMIDKLIDIQRDDNIKQAKPDIKFE